MFRQVPSKEVAPPSSRNTDMCLDSAHIGKNERVSQGKGNEGFPVGHRHSEVWERVGMRGKYDVGRANGILHG